MKILCSVEYAELLLPEIFARIKELFVLLTFIPGGTAMLREKIKPVRAKKGKILWVLQLRQHFIVTSSGNLITICNLITKHAGHCKP